MTDKPIYCSGPMFDPGDLYDMQQIANALEAAGYTTYLPQRDGLEIGKMMDMLKNPIVEATFFTRIVTAIMKAGFAMDMFQVLSNTRAVVFNMNGRVPDEGSVSETASAFIAGKPIVIYKDTPITAQGNFDNPMVMGLSTTWTVVECYDQIPPALEQRLKWAEANPYTFTPSPALQEIISKGEMVQELRDLVHDILGSSEVKALEKFAEAVEHLKL
jgi:nucleoside 2-deoxyribosyltransferase